jgi:uncharacterized protein
MMKAVASESRPGWPEALAGLVTFAAFLVVFALFFNLLPADPVTQGMVGSAAEGVAGVAGLVAAWSLRIRNLTPFGFKPVSPLWLLVAAGIAIGGYGLNCIIQEVYSAAFDYDNPQGILHAAARGGVVPFLVSLVGGAMFTPFGEETLFRGVVANALNRHGAWAGIGLSSVIFGLAHGVSVILPIAIMVGALSAILFLRTGSIWPSVVFHCVYNASNSVGSVLGIGPS